MSTRTAVATPRYLYELHNECPIAWPLKAPYLLDTQTTSNADSESSEPVTAGPAAAAAASHALPSIHNGCTLVDVEQDLEALYYNCLYKRDIIKSTSTTVSELRSLRARCCQQTLNRVQYRQTDSFRCSHDTYADSKTMSLRALKLSCSRRIS